MSGLSRESTSGRKNAYYCEDCRGYIVTIDLDEGVTPMFLACRVKGDPRDPANDCKGRMRSMMYPDEPWPAADGYGDPIPTEPTWEWFRPANPAALDDGMRDHVERGGLHLRKRGEGDPTINAPARPSGSLRRAFKGL